ncbi:GntR family transcriptional regulator [Brevibacillus fluminis]|uniref:GntR family transcriptional regulator n=1 Tax=Brevibacillus fluminis TaxID=511487 RepID=A0A3M8DI59_9BACL|nr:GntR family transcriptional regulator [Brevibacillus fluminis]RNB87706.1 GntR family transcriptional regulator [Brevibacillus fluminis]
MSDFRFSVKKTDTLRNQVYKDIKRAIIQGNLKPGTRLRESDLSEEMGVSRGPIREAILILEKEGLLLTQTHKETSVATVSEDEVLGLLNPLRVLLETFVIKKVLPSMTEEHFLKLQGILGELIAACENGKLDQVVEKDLEFHEYLISLTKEPFLISLWSSVSSRIVFHFISNGQKHQEQNFAKLIEEHQALFEVIKSRDLGSIEEELKKHIY